MFETLAFLASVSVLLALDEAITRVGSQRTTRAATRSRPTIPHARRITRSRYMAHPNKEVRS